MEEVVRKGGGGGRRGAWLTGKGAGLPEKGARTTEKCPGVCGLAKGEGTELKGGATAPLIPPHPGRGLR